MKTWEPRFDYSNPRTSNYDDDQNTILKVIQQTEPRRYRGQMVDISEAQANRENWTQVEKLKRHHLNHLQRPHESAKRDPDLIKTKAKRQKIQHTTAYSRRLKQHRRDDYLRIKLKHHKRDDYSRKKIIWNVP